MRILTLPVEDSIADSYNSVPQKEKAKINSAINVLLAKFLKNQKNTELFGIMDELSADSAQNQLTLDRLKELMNWDDDTMKNLFGEVKN